MAYRDESNRQKHVFTLLNSCYAYKAAVSNGDEIKAGTIAQQMLRELLCNQENVTIPELLVQPLENHFGPQDIPQCVIDDLKDKCMDSMMLDLNSIKFAANNNELLSRKTTWPLNLFDNVQRILEYNQRLFLDNSPTGFEDSPDVPEPYENL